MSTPEASITPSAEEARVALDCAWEGPRELLEVVGLVGSNRDLDPHGPVPSRFETFKRAGVAVLEVGIACGAVAVELTALKAKNAARRILVGTEK